MSVSLQEALEYAGYDITNNVDDAEWLLSQQDEFDELVEICERMIENTTEVEDYWNE